MVSKGGEMQRLSILITALAGIVLGQSVASKAFGAERGALSLVTAGDQNMVDYVKDYLGPLFEKDHPGVTVKAVGTGPGTPVPRKSTRSSKPRRPMPPGISMSR